MNKDSRGSVLFLLTTVKETNVHFEENTPKTAQSLPALSGNFPVFTAQYKVSSDSWYTSAFYDAPTSRLWVSCPSHNHLHLGYVLIQLEILPHSHVQLLLSQVHDITLSVPFNSKADYVLALLKLHALFHFGFSYSNSEMFFKISPQLSFNFSLWLRIKHSFTTYVYSS